MQQKEQQQEQEQELLEEEKLNDEQVLCKHGTWVVPRSATEHSATSLQHVVDTEISKRHHLTLSDAKVDCFLTWPSIIR